MLNKLCFVLLYLFFTGPAAAQVVDSTEVVLDTLMVEEPVVYGENAIANQKALQKFFDKLYQLETTKTGKVNIVHIGDSHIQADLFTGVIRKALQDKFGNAGLGFSFPYNLAKTNGSYYVRYSSNESWNSYRNIYPVNGAPVGLSGIGLTTRTKDFAIEINVKDPAYEFNTLKIVTPQKQNLFDVATSSKTIVLESNVPKKINHKIKKGEAISIIADKYNVSVAEIKRANGLKNNNIRAGKVLRIPTNEMQKKSIKRSEFIPLSLTEETNAFSYTSEEAIKKIYLLPNKKASQFALNGLVFGKNAPGVVYSSIGVNGAKFSDYNKYPLFFEQVPVLQPDLLVVSLGTNETFDKMEMAAYMSQLNQFIENIRQKNPDVEILVMTPPPSLLYRRSLNTYAADYAKEINVQAEMRNHASWDLFSIFGGLYGVNKNYRQGLMAGDKVHYSKAGYEKQGTLFTEALLQAYESYKLSTKN
ncbi:GDSL-type esterase/lipase family protein [Flavobacterium sp. UBA4197]|uniref:GDSL-type esterase/lipase family protein n=1 Tax=Flavobacterium sp. UBA4197 TaxID=1946546 RepID=UPI00257FFC9D|nr:GDSL-type esterase/lipase family protein [Flavobacterium sp. UBA4197]